MVHDAAYISATQEFGISMQDRVQTVGSVATDMVARLPQMMNEHIGVSFVQRFRCLYAMWLFQDPGWKGLLKPDS
jgi:hypothetical protein